MKVNTRKRRNARRVFEQLYGREELIDRMYQIISKGKQGLDSFVLEVGKMIAEAIMYIGREEVSRQQDGTALACSSVCTLRTRIQAGEGR